MTRLIKYMKMLLESRFLQFRVFSADGFVRFLSDRGMMITLEELEYYDKKNVLRPLLRLPSHAPTMCGFAVKNYYDQGLVEFTQDGDFRHWNDYRDNNDVLMKQYYHEYQFVPIRELILRNNIVLKPRNFEVSDTRKLFENMKENVAMSITKSQQDAKKWGPVLGLLMLLEEAYGFSVWSLSVDPNVRPRTFLDNWRDWRISEFRADSIVERTGITIDEIKECYSDLVELAGSVDPLLEWFVFLQLINNDKKRLLKDKALLAQDYYRLARMVSLFIHDLTKEKMLDPDDLLEGSKGQWKPNLYGEPFDYQSKHTRMRIRDRFLVDRRYRIAVIYEGETEHAVIETIFDALEIDPERDGVFLWNARGQGNIEKRLYAFAKLAKASEMRIFLIMDRDGNWEKIIKGFKEGKFIEDEECHVWNIDFESDNFTIDEVLQVINHRLNQLSLKQVEKEHVEYRMKKFGVGVIKSIADVIWDNNGVKFDDIISKPELGRILIEPRISGIKIEYSSGKWSPVLPIEKVLKNAFRLAEGVPVLQC